MPRKAKRESSINEDDVSPKELNTFLWLHYLTDSDSKVCLCPERIVGRFGEAVADFTVCLPWLADCNFLIFCELTRTLSEVVGILTSVKGKDMQGTTIVDVRHVHDKGGDAGEVEPSILFNGNWEEWTQGQWVPIAAKPPTERSGGIFRLLSWNSKANEES